VYEVTTQAGDERSQWDERDHSRPAEVAPQHDLLAIEPVGDDTGRRSEDDGRNGIDEQRHGHRRAAARDLVREDDQREEKELVRQLRSQLSEPDVPEGRVPQHGPKPTRTLDLEFERRRHGD
jgi:hypothetical protein